MHIFLYFRGKLLIEKERFMPKYGYAFFSDDFASLIGPHFVNISKSRLHYETIINNDFMGICLHFNI